MKSFIRQLSLWLCLVLLITVLPLSSWAADPLQITTVEMGGLGLPMAGRYAASVDGTKLTTGQSNYFVEEGSLLWRDSGGKVIDDPQYTFERGRTYQLWVTFRVINNQNYAFASGIKPVLQNFSSNDYSVRILSSTKDSIYAAFSFTVSGSREYTPVQSVVLKGITEPKAGALPTTSLEQLYGNYTIKDSNWEGTFSNNRFISGSTYLYNVYVQAYEHYTFADDAVYTLDGKAPQSVTITSITNGYIAKLVFEYHVPKAGEVSVVAVESGIGEGGIPIPMAGYLIQSYNVNLALNISGNVAYELQNGSSNWLNENGTVATENRFRHGKNYCMRLTFRVKDSNSYIFAQDVEFLFRRIASGCYTYKIIDHSGSKVTFELTFKADFAPGDGGSESTAVICDDFYSLKAALEAPSVCYLKLLDVERCDVPTPARGDGMTYPIITYGTKVLILEGDATFSLSGWTWSEKDLIPGGLIYNTGTLTVKGDGALRYLATQVNSYNATIVNRENLIIESGTIEGYIPGLKKHTYYSCAVYQNNDNAKLTINGGTFQTYRNMQATTGQAAVIVEKGTAVINGGEFLYDYMDEVTDTDCAGLYIKGANANVTLNSGYFNKIQFPGTISLSRYLGSSCQFYQGDTILSTSSNTARINYDVQVRRTLTRLNAHINAPEAGRNPAYQAYVPTGEALVFGGTSGIIWYDITSGKTLSASDSFVAGHRYRVTMKLEANASYVFQTNSSGTPNLTTTLNGYTVTPKKASGQSGGRVLEISYDFAACPNVVHHLDVSISPPFVGRTVSNHAVLGSNTYQVYDYEDIWYDKTTQKFLSSTDKFINGHHYTLELWIKAASGYVFNTDKNLDPSMTATLNGMDIAINRAYEQAADEVVSLRYDFGVLETYVDFVSVFNLEPPQPGFTPDQTADAQHLNQYEVTSVRWSCNGTIMGTQETFVAGKTYYVEIKVTPVKINGLETCAFDSETLCYLNSEQLASHTTTVEQITLRKSWVCPDTVDTVSLSGAITSFGEATDPVTLTLSGGGNTYETTSTDGNYRFGAVAAGAYTLTVSKKDHVKRTYSVSVSSNMTFDVKIHLKGDLDGNGKVNVGDTTKVYSHVKKTSLITDEYMLLCADVDGNGKINMGDTTKVYAHVKKTSLLW